MLLDRRHFFGASSSVLFGLASAGLVSQTSLNAAPQTAPNASPQTAPNPPGFAGTVDASVAGAFPLHPPAVVRDMVVASHGNVSRVKELLERWPTLSRAAVDWGYGDWEDALGAASHVGNRQIAELLLSAGARPTIFSAAMLGHLEVVRAFITASPGIAATHGPHSITLLSHAKAGGAAAAAVVEFLSGLADADRKPPSRPITLDDLRRLTGSYIFGSRASDRLIVEEARGILTIARSGLSPRNLTHVGDRAFYPAGATTVRVRFAERGATSIVSVHDPDLVVIAERVS